jgi:hypothetical protein
MEGTTAINKHLTTLPLKVSLADGHQVMSTHMFHIKTDGLPLVLTGHIIPDLSIASLFWNTSAKRGRLQRYYTFTHHDCII